MSSKLKGLLRKVGILLLPFAILFLLPDNDALGTSIGKIAGVVKDTEGNPLPGTNVQVDGILVGISLPVNSYKNQGIKANRCKGSWGYLERIDFIPGATISVRAIIVHGLS